MGDEWKAQGVGKGELIDTVASGTGGIVVTSDVMSYRVNGQPAASPNSDRSTDVLWISVSESTWGGMSTESSAATITLSGDFDYDWSGESPPVMSNLQVWCTEQSGNWGTGDDEVELYIHANGSPTVAGTPEDPHLQFACRLELKVPSADNVLLHFTLDVDPQAKLDMMGEQFEYGKCELWPQSNGTTSLVYRTWDHG